MTELGSPEEAPAPATGTPPAEVGRRRPRVDAAARVRGLVRHVGDEPLGAVAHVAVHRSTRPRARITAVHTGEARAVPGVVAVVTGADLHARFGDRMLTGPAFHDQPVLAVDQVRYVGEPVAAVLAADARTAAEAADLVVVDYDDTEPVYDLDDALAGRAFVHDQLRPATVFGDLAHLHGSASTNVNYEFVLRNGEAEPAAARAEEAGGSTVAAEFWAPPTHHVPMELPCTIASVQGDRLEMLTTTQTPSYIRQMVSGLLDLPLSRVRIATRPLGGSFGSKMYDRLEPLAAALAWITRRKVRVAASREEAFLLTTRHGARVTGSMTADADNRIVAATADVCYDTGAYADIGPRITAKSGMVAPGPYRVPNVDVRSRCIYTNKPSAGPFRGFGVPQVTWAHETLIDELAHARGADPYEFRRANLLREGDTAPMGTVVHSADLVSCLDRAAREIGWSEPLERAGGRWRRGRGIAVGMKAVLTPTVANAVLQLNQDASATLLISTVEMGQGSDTIMAQIVGEVLGLDSERVHVVAADTDVTPYDTITAGSRSTYHTGNAVRRAAEAMASRLRDMAAEQLGVAASDVKLTPQGLHSAAARRVLPLPDLILARYGARGATVTTEASFTTEWQPYDRDTGRSTKVTEHWFANAVAAQLLVDTDTGRVRVEHLAVAGDVGRAINPALCEQQLTGAAIMGIGHALFDELVLDQGQFVNGTLLDYQLPSIKDLPDRLTPIVVESPHRDGPFGAKGVGETGILAVAPAIGNAVRDAVGVRMTRLPITPERLLAALEASR